MQHTEILAGGLALAGEETLPDIHPEEVLGLQWAVGGDRLWGRRRLLLAGTMVPALYLCALDRLALHLRLWQLSSSRTTGFDPLGLPVGEALFFALTTLLVVSGLLLPADPATLTRLFEWLPRSRRPVPPVPHCPPGQERRLSARRPATLTSLRRAAPDQPPTSHRRDQSTKGALR